MKHLVSTLALSACFMATAGLVSAAEDEDEVQLQAPTAPTGLVVPALPQGPMIYETAEGLTIRVEVVARGLNHPWSIAFLPDGRYLVTEKNSGDLRIIENDRLSPEPVSGVPESVTGMLTGLLDVTLHPDFESEPYVYLSYNKALGDQQVVAVARGRLEGQALVDTSDIFISKPGTVGGTRLLFGPDGMLYVSLFGATEDNRAQDMQIHSGKILRLTPAGQVPPDNPFVGNPDVLPEIFSVGHRSTSGMTIDPASGQLFSVEMGPNGGDEINILKAGANYGWPLVSLGRTYLGERIGRSYSQEGFEDPIVYWMPSISVSGLTIYNGDAMPQWQGDIFVGGLREGQIPGTGQLQRIKVDDNMQELRRESLLVDLRQRVRDVKQGPDGFLYVLTDEDDGAVLRIRPQ